MKEEKGPHQRTVLQRFTGWAGWGALLLGLLLPITSAMLVMFSSSYAAWLTSAYEPAKRLAASENASMFEFLSATPAIGITMAIGSVLIFVWIGCWLLQAGLFAYRSLRAPSPRAE